MDEKTLTTAWTAPELREESITDLTANANNGTAADAPFWGSTGTAYSTGS